MGLLDVFMNMLGGPPQGAPGPQIEGQGEVDTSHYDEHAKRGDERVAGEEQAKKEWEAERKQSQGAAKGAAARANIEAGMLRGERLSAVAQKEQRENAVLAQLQQPQPPQGAAPVIRSPSPFRAWLSTARQRQSTPATSGTTPHVHRASQDHDLS